MLPILLWGFIIKQAMRRGPDLPPEFTDSLNRWMERFFGAGSLVICLVIAALIVLNAPK